MSRGQLRLRLLGRAFRLVWESAPGWTAASLALVAAQGLLPLASLYLVKLLVDALAAAFQAGVAAPPRTSRGRSGRRHLGRGVGGRWPRAPRRSSILGVAAAVAVLEVVCRVNRRVRHRGADRDGHRSPGRRHPRQVRGPRPRLLRGPALLRHAAPRAGGGRLAAHLPGEQHAAGGAGQPVAGRARQPAALAELGGRARPLRSPPSRARRCACATPAASTSGAAAAPPTSGCRGTCTRCSPTASTRRKRGCSTSRRLLAGRFRDAARAPARRAARHLAPRSTADSVAQGGGDARHLRHLRRARGRHGAPHDHRRRLRPLLPGVPARPGLAARRPQQPREPLRGQPVPRRPVRVPGPGRTGSRQPRQPAARTARITRRRQGPTLRHPTAEQLIASTAPAPGARPPAASSTSRPAIVLRPRRLTSTRAAPARRWTT